MLRRRHINGDPRKRGMRFLLAATDALRWPFERAAWSVERHLVWPLQRSLAGRGAPRRGAGVAALATIAAAALVAVLILPGSGEPAREQSAAQPSRVAIVTADHPQPQAEQPQSPSLHGVPPHFGVGNGVGVSKSSGGASAGPAEAPSPPADAPASTAAPATEAGAGATASSAAKPVPAGPAAMKVARRFSEAFVFYEIGKKPARAKAVFDETATEQLAKALEERPPRLPSDAKVPKAKVLNLVPGPRFGAQYTVSVSLLRVGITSELRLTLQKEKDGGWSVAQILG